MAILELMIPGFVIGLLGAGHCLGMCGGISAALSFALPQASINTKYRIIAAYNLGRISSYTFMGMASGVLGSMLDPGLLNISGLPLLRIFAALMLMLMGLYISGWWRILGTLERAGAGIWRCIQPLSRKLLPVKSLKNAVLLGVLWGWLPCGLIYSALVYALAQAHPVSSALVMFSFGLGTLPALILAGVAGEQLRAVFQNYRFRAAMAVLLIVYGLWTLVFAFAHHHHHHPVTSERSSETSEIVDPHSDH